jgi:hypothetical protein
MTMSVGSEWSKLKRFLLQHDLRFLFIVVRQILHILYGTLKMKPRNWRLYGASPPENNATNRFGDPDFLTVEKSATKPNYIIAFYTTSKVVRSGFC